jgi:hypothetical protein
MYILIWKKHWAMLCRKFYLIERDAELLLAIVVERDLFGVDGDPRGQC